MKFNNKNKIFLLAFIFATMMNTRTFANIFTHINNIQAGEYIQNLLIKVI